MLETGTGGTMSAGRSPEDWPKEGAFGFSNAAEDPVASNSPAKGAVIPPKLNQGDTDDASKASSSWVANAAVMAVPDAEKTEEIVALVVLRDGMEASPQELYAHCQARLAKFKWPRYFGFRRTFPLTASGKVAKHEILKETPDLLAGAFDVQTSAWVSRG